MRGHGSWRADRAAQHRKAKRSWPAVQTFTGRSGQLAIQRQASAAVTPCLADAERYASDKPCPPGGEQLRSAPAPPTAVPSLAQGQTVPLARRSLPWPVPASTGLPRPAAPSQPSPLRMLAPESFREKESTRCCSCCCPWAKGWARNSGQPVKRLRSTDDHRHGAVQQLLFCLADFGIQKIT